MRNVLFICEYRSTYSGNFIKSICALTSELEKDSCRCFFVFPKQAEQREWINMFQHGSVIFLDFNMCYFSFLREVSRIVDKHDIGIIHSHFHSVNKAKLISFVCTKAKVFVHLHSDFSNGHLSKKAKAKQFLTYHTLVSKLRFLCVSNEFVKFNPKKSCWIPNAVVCDSRIRSIKERKKLREKYGIDDKDCLVELFGWSPEVKGVDIAVEAIKKTNADGHCFKLLIVCGVQYDETGMQKYIAEHTSCTGKEDYLIYTSPTEDVFSYHHAADVLLSASRSEGFSYSIVEMLSLGKRCVVSNIPGTSWAQEFPSVCAFTSEDSLDCEKALLQAEELEPYNENVEKNVKDKYAIDRWVQAVIAAYL